MKQIANFIVLHFDIILTVWFICFRLSFIYGAKYYVASADNASNTVITAMDAPAVRLIIRSRAYQVVLILPLAITILLLLAIAQSNALAVAVLILIFAISSFFFLLVDALHTGTLFWYSDIGNQLLSLWFHGLILVCMGLLSRIIYRLYSAPWCISVICWISCISQVICLYQAWLSGCGQAIFFVPTIPRLICSCSQAALSLALWAVGGFSLTAFLGLRSFTWKEWLQTVLFYGEGAYVICMRITGILLLLTLIPVVAETVSCLKRSAFISQRLRTLVPAATTVISLAVCGTYLLSIPNYIQTLSVPMTTYLGSYSIIGSDAENYTMIDELSMVLENGAPICLETSRFPYGESFFVTISPLDDFSSRPYLRFYAEASGDGCVSIRVENQGGIPAENCTFRLSDQDDLLKECFPKDILHTGVDAVAPDEDICLFTLGVADMRRTMYEMIPLELEVEASFTDQGQTRNLRKAVREDVSMCMQGMYLESNWRSWNTNAQLTPDGIVQLSEALDHTFAANHLASVQCSQTMLVEVCVAIRYIDGSTTMLPPLALIYECE